MKDHKELDVWKSSVDLVVKVYEITRDFPKEEMYGLNFADKKICSFNTFKYF